MNDDRMFSNNNKWLFFKIRIIELGSKDNLIISVSLECSYPLYSTHLPGSKTYHPQLRGPSLGRNKVSPGVYGVYSISSCFIQFILLPSVGPGLSCSGSIMTTLKGDC